MTARLWSTTAGSNNSAPPVGSPEGQTPGSLNNVIRQVMADARDTFEQLPFFDFGETPTRIDNDTFTVTTDLTARYQVGRRIKFIGATTGYGTITASAYSAVTTVDVTMDSGNIPTSLTTVSVGPDPSSGIPGYYKITAAETAASVTPTNYAEYPGYIERYGGSQSASAATNATALTNALLTGHRVRFKERSGFYPLTGRIVAPANSWITLDGCELRWSATAATGSNFLGTATRPGIEATGNYFQLDGYGLITGPSTASYVANECAIYMTGTSTSVRKSGLWINGKIEFTKWGSYGVLASFVDRIELKGPYIHDCGYIGANFSSCDHGEIRRCEISNLTPGTASETHGISLGHNSSLYNLDVNAATNGRLTANPFCADWDIDSNEIWDCPLWTGIDGHGGYEITVRHNKIYNCLRGIQIASGSGDAANYAGESNTIAFNSITPRRRDGSATTVSGGEIYGITINGGSTVEHRAPRVIGNDIEGCGNTSQNSSAITATRVIAAVIQGNTIRNWAGPAIYSSNGDGLIVGNNFGSVSNATVARCIRLDTGSRAWVVQSNKLLLNGGTAPAEGLRITLSTADHTVEDNDFDAATTPYVGVSGAVTQITSSSTGVTVSNRRGTITTVALTTAAAAEEVFTVTNTLVTALDVIDVSTTYAGAGTPAITVKGVAAGSFVVVITNLHAANALNAALTINFYVKRGLA